MANYVEKKCKHCGCIYKTLFKNRHRGKFCSRKCVNEKQTGHGNPAFGKVYQTKEMHPEWALNISKASKGKINIGDANGMKNADAKAKLSKTRKEMMQNPEVRKNLAEKSRQAWADGKFDGVRVGQCQWFTYTKKDGSVIKLQGTWELAFAKWADNKELKFDTHKGRIEYKDEIGNIKSYYPDFYFYDWNCWVDIKNDYHFNLQKEKFEQIKKSNPEKVIKIILKKELISLGVFER